MLCDFQISAKMCGHKDCVCFIIGFHTNRVSERVKWIGMIWIECASVWIYKYLCVWVYRSNGLLRDNIESYSLIFYVKSKIDVFCLQLN